MPDFSKRELLGEMVAHKSYTPQGQRQLADYIATLVNRKGLGDAKVVDYPADANFHNVDRDAHPANVVIDIGQGTEETILWHGHIDTVPPPTGRPNFPRNPHQLISDPNNQEVAYGLGSYDMLGGVAAFILALRNIKVDTCRRIRILLVSYEEDLSQGTHAALHPSKDLVGDAHGIVSTEIPVGGTLNDDPFLLIGRQGRVGMQLEVHGPGMHMGRVTREALKRALAPTREGLVRTRLGDIYLPEHPEDHLKLMPESLVVPGQNGSNKIKALSVPHEQGISLNVSYSNPHLDAMQIHAMMRDEIARILGDTNFELHLQDRGGIPTTKPWLESPGHPFVQNGLTYAKQAHGRDVKLRAGGATADEAILVHAKNIPAIGFPPMGEDEHLPDERVSLSSIEKHVVPFLQGIAAHEGPITRNRSAA